jgi:hypothetical protein
MVLISYLVFGNKSTVSSAIVLNLTISVDILHFYIVPISGFSFVPFKTMFSLGLSFLFFSLVYYCGAGYLSYYS